MAVAANIIVYWFGTAASIPSGWQREPGLDAKFHKGTAASTDPNTTGGAATHTHTTPNHNHSANHGHANSALVSNQGAAGTVGSTTTTLGGRTTHTHTIGAFTSASYTSADANPSGDSQSNEPAYIAAIYIKSDGSPVGIPVNAAALFNAVGFPSGWNLCDGASGRPETRNKFIRGATAAGDGGGTGGTGSAHAHTVAAHTHGLTHTHAGITAGTASAARGGSGSSTGSSATHTHTVVGNSTAATLVSTSGGATAGGTFEPPWKKQCFIQNNNAGGDLPSGVIGLWLGSLATIPTDWVLCDGSNATPDLRSLFIKGANTTSEIGNTGGAVGHGHTAGSHSHATFAHTHTCGFSEDEASATNLATGSNTSSMAHAANHNIASSAYDGSASGSATPTVDSATDSQPAFTTVAYIQYRPTLTATVAETSTLIDEQSYPRSFVKATQLQAVRLPGRRYSSFARIAGLQEIVETVSASHSQSAVTQITAPITEPQTLTDAADSTGPRASNLKTNQFQASLLPGRRYGAFTGRSGVIATAITETTNTQSTQDSGGFQRDDSPTSDTPSAVYVAVVAIADTLTTSDAFRAGELCREAVTITDTPSAVYVTLVDRPEAATIGDTPSAVYITAASIGESSTISDLSDTGAQCLEQVNVLDTPSATFITAISRDEITIISDTPSAVYVSTVLISESSTAASFTDIAQECRETITATDTPSAVNITSASRAESTSIADTPNLGEQIAETVNAVDTLSAVSITTASASDSIPTTEQSNTGVIQAEPITISEVFSATYIVGAQRAEATIILDTPQAGELRREDISTQDSATGVVLYAGITADTLTTSHTQSSVLLAIAAATDVTNTLTTASIPFVRKTRMQASTLPGRNYGSFISKRVPIFTGIADTLTVTESIGVGSLVFIDERHWVNLTDGLGNIIVDENGRPIQVSVDMTSDIASVVGGAFSDSRAELTTITETESVLTNFAVQRNEIVLIGDTSGATSVPFGGSVAETMSTSEFYQASSIAAALRTELVNTQENSDRTVVGLGDMPVESAPAVDSPFGQTVLTGLRNETLATQDFQDFLGSTQALRNEQTLIQEFPAATMVTAVSVQEITIIGTAEAANVFITIGLSVNEGTTIGDQEDRQLNMIGSMLEIVGTAGDTPRVPEVAASQGDQVLTVQTQDCVWSGLAVRAEIVFSTELYDFVGSAVAQISELSNFSELLTAQSLRLSDLADTLTISDGASVALASNQTILETESVVDTQRLLEGFFDGIDETVVLLDSMDADGVFLPHAELDLNIDDTKTIKLDPRNVKRIDLDVRVS